MSREDDDLFARFQRLKVSENDAHDLTSSKEMDDRIQKLVTSSHSAVKESREKRPTKLNDDELQVLLEELSNEPDDIDEGLDDIYKAAGTHDAKVNKAVEEFLNHPSLSSVPTSSTISQGQEADLIQQLRDEAHLESKYSDLAKKLEDDMIERYKNLRSGSGIPVSAKPDKLSQKKQREKAALGAPPKPLTLQDFERSDDEEDMQHWCGICNEDARYICQDCDDEKYCVECFREAHPHNNPEMRHHRYEKYSKKRR